MTPEDARYISRLEQENAVLREQMDYLELENGRLRERVAALENDLSRIVEQERWLDAAAEGGE